MAELLCAHYVAVEMLMDTIHAREKDAIWFQFTFDSRVGKMYLFVSVHLSARMSH